MTRELQLTLELFLKWVASIEKPQTVRRARHSAGFECVYTQFRCKRPHLVFGSRWAQSSIWREWKHRHCEESKTAKRGQTRINKVSAMRLGLAKRNEKLYNSRHFESPETDHQIAENAYWVDSTDTWLSKRVHSLSKGQSTNCGTTNYGSECMGEFDTAVVWARIPITRSHPQAVEETIIQLLPAALHITGWMDHHHICHGSALTLSLLVPVDVEKAYSYSETWHHCLLWHVGSYGRRYASFG